MDWLGHLIDPLNSEQLDAECRRDLLVWKAILAVRGKSEDEKAWIYGVSEWALNELELSPMRYPSSRRNQIRRAFLLLLQVEAAHERDKSSALDKFQAASIELGLLRGDDGRFDYNPYLLYRRIANQEAPDLESSRRMFKYHWFLNMETVESVIDLWSQFPASVSVKN
jgi:hypothetical protein